MKSFKQHLAEYSTSQYETASIELQAKKEHINTILTMLKTISDLGSDGSSRTIQIFVDGDGAFNMKMKTNIDVEGVEYDDDIIKFVLD